MMPYRESARRDTSASDAEELRTFATRLRRLDVLPRSGADRGRAAWVHGARLLACLPLIYAFGPLWWMAALAAAVSFVQLVVVVVVSIRNTRALGEGDADRLELRHAALGAPALRGRGSELEEMLHDRGYGATRERDQHR